MVSQFLAFPTSARGSFHSSTVSNLNRKHTPVAGGIGPDIVGETPETEPERETIRPSAFAFSRKRRMVSRFGRSVDHEESATGVSRPVVDSNVGQLQPIELPQFRHL